MQVNFTRTYHQPYSAVGYSPLLYTLADTEGEGMDGRRWEKLQLLRLFLLMNSSSVLVSIKMCTFITLLIRS